jgi:hypothetical protein
MADYIEEEIKRACKTALGNNVFERPGIEHAVALAFNSQLKAIAQFNDGHLPSDFPNGDLQILLSALLESAKTALKKLGGTDSTPNLCAQAANEAILATPAFGLPQH